MDRPAQLSVTGPSYRERMVVTWFQSRLSREGRFFRHLRDGRWDKLIPSHQQKELANFITRAALTPGREEILLRFAFGKEKTEYLWAVYEIVEADISQCHLKMRTLFVPEEGYELITPVGYQSIPFFAVEQDRSNESRGNEGKAA